GPGAVSRAGTFSHDHQGTSRVAGGTRRAPPVPGGADGLVSERPSTGSGGQPPPRGGVSERIASVWVLAALAAADADGPLPDELGAVLGAAGYAESSPEGWTLHPSYRMTGTSRSF